MIDTKKQKEGHIEDTNTKLSVDRRLEEQEKQTFSFYLPFG